MESSAKPNTHTPPLLLPLVVNFAPLCHCYCSGATPKDFRVLPDKIFLVRHAESEGNVDNVAYTYIPDPQVPLVSRRAEAAHGLRPGQPQAMVARACRGRRGAALGQAALALCWWFADGWSRQREGRERQRGCWRYGGWLVQHYRRRTTGHSHLPRGALVGACMPCVLVHFIPLEGGWGGAGRDVRV